MPGMANRPGQSALPAEYWRTWTAAFLFFASFYALLVPLPLYLAACHFADWQVGVILGAFGIASLVTRPLAGACADVWGRRPLLLLGSVALIVGAGGVPFTQSLAPLFALRIMQAVGYVAFTTAISARVSDLAAPEKKGSALALFGISINLAMTLTPMAVNAALDRLTVRGAFGISAALAAVAALLSLGRPDKPGVANTAANWLAVWQVPPVLLTPAAAAVLFGAGFGAFFQFLPLLAQRREIPSIGFAYAVYGIGVIVARLVTGRWQDGRDRRRLLAPAFILGAAGLVLLGLAHSLDWLLAGSALLAIAGGIVHPGLMACHVELASEAIRGRAVAFFYLAFDLGIGLGTWLLAPVLEGHGFQGLFLSAAVLTALGALPVWQISSPDRTLATRERHG